MTFAEPESDKRKNRRGVLLAIAGVVVLLGGLYVAGHFLLGDRLPVGTKVGGVDVGTMTVDDARAKLDKKLAPKLEDPITFAYKDKTIKVPPKKAGLSFRLDETLENAGGDRTWNPVQMVQVLVGRGSVDPVLTVDRSALRAQTQKVADRIDKKAVEPRITFENQKPKVRKPQTGRKVDQKKTAELIRTSYLVDHDAGRVPTTTRKPKVGEDELEQTLKRFAEPAVDGPVTLDTGKKSVPLRVDVFAPALTVRVKDGELSPVIDPKRLEGPLERATQKIGRKARDATVKLNGNQPKVVPSRSGIKIDAKKVAKALVPVLTKSGDNRKISIDPRTVKPDFTTKEAKQLGIKEKVSSFSTDYPHAKYRNVNQGRAAELIDGTVLKPGETFSLNDTVGERTRANGFTSGTIISDGVFRDALGGGVSQVATTLYNAAFFAGLEDVTHKPHSFYIDRYPVGREATVAWPSVDLSFRNNTDHGVLIHTWIEPSSSGSEGTMHVEMWSTKTWKITAGLSKKRNFTSPEVKYDPSDECVPQSGTRGFDVTVYRNFFSGGERVKRESITTHYNAADEVRCRAKPD